MFVRYYTFINHPFVEVRRTLVEAHASWLPGVAREVNGGDSLAELRVGFRGMRFHKTVTMDFAPPIDQGTLRTALPFRWRASAMPALFPSFDGDIQVSNWREETTQLALSANYQPPLGPVGLMLDKAALHVVAEALVKDFVDRVAGAIDAELTTTVPATV
ncbi:MAG: hypothetical protein M3R21_06325 [Candidatus Dormibacteraeota bacterium]|nr:hypothetical protein [Candidatus Dormibacteraeota bacterium]